MKEVGLAGCVVLDEYGRVLLLHRYSDDYSHWELHGGKIEKDETAEAAAVREMSEELGIDVRLTKTLGSEVFEDREVAYRYHWFQAEISSGEPAVMETDKFDDVDYFDFEDLLSLSLSENMLVLLPMILSGAVALDY